MSILYTENPRAAIDKLKQAGICEAGTPSAAFSACPADAYCALPANGELCIHAYPVQAAATQPTAAVPGAGEAREITGLEVVSVLSVFVAGILIGRYWPSRRRPPEKK